MASYNEQRSIANAQAEEDARSGLLASRLPLVLLSASCASTSANINADGALSLLPATSTTTEIESPVVAAAGQTGTDCGVPLVDHNIEEPANALRNPSAAAVLQPDIHAAAIAINHEPAKNIVMVVHGESSLGTHAFSSMHMHAEPTYTILVVDSAALAIVEPMATVSPVAVETVQTVPPIHTGTADSNAVDAMDLEPAEDPVDVMGDVGSLDGSSLGSH